MAAGGLEDMQGISTGKALFSVHLNYGYSDSALLLLKATCW